jgi:hypothetical protein
MAYRDNRRRADGLVDLLRAAKVPSGPPGRRSSYPVRTRDADGAGGGMPRPAIRGAGRLRVVPPSDKEAALRQDYVAMREMPGRICVLRATMMAPPIRS